MRDVRIGGAVCCLHIGADGLYLPFTEMENIFVKSLLLIVLEFSFVNGLGVMNVDNRPGKHLYEIDLPASNRWNSMT